MSAHDGAPTLARQGPAVKDDASRRTTALRDFTVALREAREHCPGERAMIAHARELTVTFAARQSEWLTEAMCVPDAVQGFGAHLLHEEPDHTLAAFVVSWLPGRGTPPHDHGSWAVIVGLRGSELNRMWRRLDDGGRPGHAVLAPASERAIAMGGVVAMPSGAIHSVRNESDEVSVSLHVYGLHFNHARRSQFDPEARTEMPYQVRVSA
ncbi:cysteine dioxygenase [Burkholderiales bacterium]|nr:cysteine dioxygenase [Burkholderiales bacterium]